MRFECLGQRLVLVVVVVVVVVGGGVEGDVEDPSPLNLAVPVLWLGDSVQKAFRRLHREAAC